MARTAAKSRSSRATEAHQGEIILGKRGIWIWIAVFVVIVALAILGT